MIEAAVAIEVPGCFEEDHTDAASQVLSFLDQGGPEHVPTFNQVCSQTASLKSNQLEIKLVPFQRDRSLQRRWNGTSRDDKETTCNELYRWPSSY